MHVSLFSRLTLGYLAIFAIVAAASSYAILELTDFGNQAESILRIDNRVLDHEKFLTDLLLSQSRAEQKFVLSRDEAWYLQFVRLKIDFETRVESAAAVADALAQAIVRRVRENYRRYVDLVDDEARWVRTKKNYPQARFKQDKDNLVDAMLDELERLRANQQQTTYSKVKELAAAAAQAREAALSIAAGSLLAIVLMSLLITKSITRPLAALKAKTQEIARGNFDHPVQVKSPREIGELAAALNSMSQQLKELDRMKADFFASMSHELRTPLTSIKEGTGLLLDGVGGATTEKQQRLLGIITEESNRLISLVNTFLDLSKMEAGMTRYDFETTHIEPLINRAVAEITPLVEAKQIHFESALDGPMPAVRLDPERILQVLRNLMGNAVKFTPKGGQVSVAAKSHDGILEVSVKDSGPGIPAESLGSIFEKFSQGSHAGANHRQGTGLGLAIAKNIITSHGGNIWAESQLGSGSKFVFVLPC
jgi:two-component system, NtrC family, sensor histidine kinase GlrK